MPDQLTTILQAASFAATKHRDQRRKDIESSPYINHPLAVANVLANEAGISDTNLIAAALLHDTVEDTDTEPEELASLFGSEISRLVAEVTDDKSLRKAERKQFQVDHASTRSEKAKQLKIADKICNVRDINRQSPEGWDIKRKSEYLDWAEKVVAGCRGVNSPLDDLISSEIAAARERL